MGFKEAFLYRKFMIFYVRKLSYKDENMWIKKASIIDSNEFFVSINPDFSHLTYKKEDCRIIARVVLYFNDFQF